MGTSRLFLVGGVLVVACGGGGGPGEQPDAAPPQGVSLQGGVEKGPFLIGSSVSVSPLDSNSAPTGALFQTQTSDDEGRFSVTLPAPGPIAVEASGFYYNEISGGLSTAAIVLRAYDEIPPSSTHTTFLNVITHLSHDRVQNLIAGGATLADATTQAEEEVREALAVGVGYDPGPGTSLSELAGDTDPAAYLLAVSSVLMNAATIQAGPTGSVDGALQALLNAIAVDLATDGTLSPARTTTVLSAQAMLDPDLVMDQFAAYLASIGSTAAVPDIRRVLDRDQDTVVDASDNCQLVANTDQADEDGNGLGDACSVLQCGDGFHVPGEICLMPVVSTITAPPMEARRDLRLGDFNDDGHLDVAFSGEVDGAVIVPGDGTGALGAAETFAVASPRGLAVGDLDGDLIHDLVIDADPVGSIVGSAIGAYAPLSSPGATGVRHSETPSQLFHYDADGDLDLFSLIYEAGTGAPPVLEIFPGDWYGTFGAPVRTVSTVTNLNNAVAGDFDTDGYVDLLAVTDDWDYWGATPLPISLVFLSGGPTHDFTTPVVTPLEPIPYIPSSMTTADVDGDGLDDVLVALGHSNDPNLARVDILHSNGDGTFTKQYVLGPTYGAQRMVVTDMDIDGDADIVLQVSGLGIYVSRGDGLGGFEAMDQILTAPIHPSDVGDVNGDGIPDLVGSLQAPSGYAGDLVVYLGGNW